jgi:hypothetical protein
VLSVLATVAGLALVEFGYRVAAGQPVLALKNWRLERIEQRTLGARAIYDPVLGWKLRPDYASDGYNTIAHGIRRNRDERAVRTGGILAVGDSFTDGWDDVRDAETWPAQLERMTETPVLNAGVGGYATDQIVMRAEMLLPLVRPKTLIVGFLEEDIFRSGHSSFGASKPYFTLSRSELTYHPPAPMAAPDQRTASWTSRLREAFGHSAVLHVILGRLAPRFWYGRSGEEVFTRVDNDPVGVTCALLRRLKARTDADGVRALLFLQHGWHMIVEHTEPSDNARRVADCARGAGFEVVDQFASLRDMAVKDLAGFTRLYAREGDGYGHLNADGNRHAAQLLARALKP